MMKKAAMMTAAEAFLTAAFETTGAIVENSSTSKLPNFCWSAVSIVPRSPGACGRGVATALGAAVGTTVTVAAGVAPGAGVGVGVAANFRSRVSLAAM